MRQRLLVIVNIALLALSGWSGVLAAVGCRHAGARGQAPETHACCRKEAGEEGAHCSMPVEHVGDEHEETSHASHEATDASAAQHHQHSAEVVPANSQTRLFIESTDSSCSHCVGHSSLPPASLKVSASSDARRGERDVWPASSAQEYSASALASFVRKIIPSQGAPPGAADSSARLHVLLGVFLI